MTSVPVLGQACVVVAAVCWQVAARVVQFACGKRPPAPPAATKVLPPPAWQRLGRQIAQWRLKAVRRGRRLHLPV